MGAEQSQQTPQPAPVEADDEPIGSPSALVICGPSGVGKGTLIELLLEDSEGFAFCTSHTTRQPRGTEKNGVEYYFVSKAEFETGIDNKAFLEFAKVHDNYYGTSRAAVDKVLDSGACCLLDIDVQGARQVRKSGLRAVFVFIAPPSEEELERRLRGRGTDSEDQIFLRLKSAREEMQSMAEPGLFDFCIVNNDLSQAYAELRLIASKARKGQLPDVVENGAVSPQKREISQDVGLNGMQQWKDKIALVTDAGSLLGTDLCRALSRSGMRLIAVGRTHKELEKLQATLMNNGQTIVAQSFLPVVCDITKEGEVQSLRKIARKRWPQASAVDVLINLASYVKEEAGLVDGSTSAWIDMLSSNVLGSLLCSREALKDMKEHEEWGYIVNVSVIDSTAPAESIPLFRATSQALKSLTQDLRHEVKEKSYGAHVVSISSEAPRETPTVVRAVLSLLATHLDTTHLQL